MIRTLLTVVLALVLASAASPAAEPPDPCSLLTKAQVTRAIGYKVDTLTRGAGVGRGMRTCTWQAAAIGYFQTKPSLEVDALRVSEGLFKQSGVANGYALTPGFGTPAYVLMNGTYVLAWKKGIEVTFVFQQAATTPKSTIAVVRTALARL